MDHPPIDSALGGYPTTKKSLSLKAVNSRTIIACLSRWMKEVRGEAQLFLLNHYVTSSTINEDVMDQFIKKL